MFTFIEHVRSPLYTFAISESHNEYLIIETYWKLFLPYGNFSFWSVGKDLLRTRRMLSQMITMTKVKCPLCDLDLKKEKIFWNVPAFVILRTKDLKGHRERIMIVYKVHRHEIPFEVYEAALDALIKIGKEVFKYVPKFVIMDSTFATMNEHWHLVATDLDPKSEDFNQILTTKWIKIIDNTWD